MLELEALGDAALADADADADVAPAEPALAEEAPSAPDAGGAGDVGAGSTPGSSPSQRGLATMIPAMPAAVQSRSITMNAKSF